VRSIQRLRCFLEKLILQPQAFMVGSFGTNHF